MSFNDLGLSAELLRAVSDQGYSNPTPIQAKAIPIIPVSYTHLTLPTILRV